MLNTRYEKIEWQLKRTGQWTHWGKEKRGRIKASLLGTVVRGLPQRASLITRGGQVDLAGV